MAVALVVEHDDDIRTLVSLSAAKAGLDPVAADCGEAAMTLLADGLKPRYPLDEHALCAARAQLAEHAGDHAEAATLYADAAQRWEQFTSVLEQAHALLAQGRCLTHTGDPTADQPLRQARALFEQMGARPRIQECDTLIAHAARLSS